MLGRRPLPKLPPEAKRDGKAGNQARPRSVPNPYETEAYSPSKQGAEYMYPDLSTPKESGLPYEELPDGPDKNSSTGVYEQLPQNFEAYQSMNGGEGFYQDYVQS